jgi:hypothetical protein
MVLKETEDINQGTAGAGKAVEPGDGERPAVVPGGRRANLDEQVVPDRLGISHLRG